MQVNQRQHFVSIHAPVKGATILHFRMGVYQKCFNPRTREGCDFTVVFTSQSFVVSIHAPVKGATCQMQVNQRQHFVSIHAPVKGATRLTILIITDLKRFNPRTREGCDDVVLSCNPEDNYVSIHAPVKGATVAVSAYLLIYMFQSTHP